MTFQDNTGHSKNNLVLDLDSRVDSYYFSL